MSPAPSFSIHAGALAHAFDRACADLVQRRFAERLWARHADLWSADAGVQRLVSNRLGWLGALDVVTAQADRIRSCVDRVHRDGFTDVLLLGMGGSSLAPEVLRLVLAPARGALRFSVLDTVDPDSVRPAMARAATTLFVLASKSGSTIEPNAMAAEARRRVLDAGHTDWGSRFIAITDADTSLHRRAVAETFREVFVNPTDIGGRFSALSLFGMVPAALMGIDLDAVASAARDMEAQCRRPDPTQNPGLALGAIMAAGALAGRDKLSLRLPGSVSSVGLWVEQLVAESTGKGGHGVVPVVNEPRAVLAGADRLLVSVDFGGEHADPDQAALESGDTPLVTLRMDQASALGAEFLRWEVATATAGALLGINPFDEPNVQQAKDATRDLLDTFRAHGRLPLAEPHARRGGARLTLSASALQALAGADPARFLSLLGASDYAAVLAYLPPDDAEWSGQVERLRTGIAVRTGRATTTGYGPRYLHSTGQLHKGGPNSGVFVIIAAPPVEDLPVPGEAYSFGVLEAAQALGDFASLDRAGRRALLLHLDTRDSSQLATVVDTLLGVI